jgi:hypothetical protein
MDFLSSKTQNATSSLDHFAAGAKNEFSQQHQDIKLKGYGTFFTII